MRILSRTGASVARRAASHRSLHTDSSTANPQSVLSSASIAGCARLSNRALIEVRGHDAPQFLQGLTTVNIPTAIPKRSSAIYSAFLNAQGRLLQDVFIYPLRPNSSILATGPSGENVDPVFLVEVDVDQASNLVKWLRKYKLRSKVSIRSVSNDELAISSIWDDSIPLDQLFGEKQGHEDADALCAIDQRAPKFGLRVLHRPKGNLSMRPQVEHRQYALRRYLHCIPEGQSELWHQSALVHESNIDYMHGVDFRKGCYVGQELVIRTQHTGVVRKRILPCVLYDSAHGGPEKLAYDNAGLSQAPRAQEIPSGADVKNAAEEGKRARSKGKWLAGVGNIGLALCRLEEMVGLGPTGEGVEGWDGSSQWSLDWDGRSVSEEGLRLKAFVPEWWSQRRIQIQNS